MSGVYNGFSLHIPYEQAVTVLLDRVAIMIIIAIRN